MQDWKKQFQYILYKDFQLYSKVFFLLNFKTFLLAVKLFSKNNKLTEDSSFDHAAILFLKIKAHSHSPQRSADSAVDCVNAEIGIFLSLRSNTTICCRRMRKMQ